MSLGLAGFNTGAIITGQKPDSGAATFYNRAPVAASRRIGGGYAQATGAAYYRRNQPLFANGSNCGCAKAPIVNVSTGSGVQDRRDGNNVGGDSVILGDDNTFLSKGANIPGFNAQFNPQSIDPARVMQDKLSDDNFITGKEILKAILMALITGAILYWLKKYAV